MGGESDSGGGEHEVYGGRLSGNNPFTDDETDSTTIGSGMHGSREEAIDFNDEYNPGSNISSVSPFSKGQQRAVGLFGPLGPLVSAVMSVDPGKAMMDEEGITKGDLRESERQAEEMGGYVESGDEGSVSRRASRVAQSARDQIGSPIIKKDVSESPSAIEEEEKARKRKGRASTMVTGRLGLQGPVNVSRRSITRLGR